MFTLELHTEQSVEIVEETLQNTRTNEEISISCRFDNVMEEKIVTIKQAPSKKPSKKKHKLSK